MGDGIRRGRKSYAATRNEEAARAHELDKQEQLYAKSCKHDSGWVIEEPVSIFIDRKGAFFLDYQRGKSAKLLAKCNNPKCGATRNIYIPQGSGIIWGNIIKKVR